MAGPGNSQACPRLPRLCPLSTTVLWAGLSGLPGEREGGGRWDWVGRDSIVSLQFSSPWVAWFCSVMEVGMGTSDS